MHRSLPALFLLRALTGGFLLCALAGGLWTAEAMADERPSPGAPPQVDFGRDIQPILQQQCVSCHRAAAPSGGLALHSKAAALEAGDSGFAILGGPLDKNALWDRVSSPDPDYRMPKGGKLSDEELARIKAWILQGSPWPDATPGAMQVDDVPGLWQVLQRLRRGWYPYALIGLLLLLWLGVKVRAARAAGQAPPGVFRPLAPVLRHIRPTHVLLGVAILTTLIGVDWVQSAARNNSRLRDHLNRRGNDSPLYEWYFGSPPAPHRPDLPKRLETLWYRGNCERHPDLHNGGRYRTAVFRLALVDGEGNVLRHGDAIPDSGARIRFRIHRSPNTAPTMYLKKNMARVFLSPVHYKGRQVTLKPNYVVLQELEADQVWEATIPLPRHTLTHGGKGLWYVYQNLRTDGRPFTPRLHYGIRYEIHLNEDGTLSPDADLWIGNLFWTTAMEPPPRPFTLPAAEWFDHNPIPEIPDGAGR